MLKTELIFIGSELLLGQILNTNAQFLSRELLSLGLDCHFQTVVGDNTQRVHQALQVALQRADVIITTGGLGPTSDDLTIESISSFFEVPLIFDEEVLETVKACFARVNRNMSESNRKLAFRPQGSVVLPNPVGSAPGIIWDVAKLWSSRGNKSSALSKFILTFPGVPKEMKAMWTQTALPFLAGKLASDSKLYFKELKFYGIGESALAEKCQHLLDLNDPTVAPLTAEAECRLRIATKAANQDLADQKINTVEEQIRQIAGEFIYGENEDTLESVVAELLKTRGETIALAESCTGGLLSKRLTDVPGSSQFIKCNLVTYSNESKQKLLKVPGELLQQKGAVEPEVAIAMASGAKELAQTNWGLGITGIAGPDGGSEEKPVGLVYVAIVGANDYKKVLELRLGQRSRQDVRWVTSQEALNLVRKELLHDTEKVL